MKQPPSGPSPAPKNIAGRVSVRTSSIPILHPEMKAFYILSIIIALCCGCHQNTISKADAEITSSVCPNNMVRDSMSESTLTSISYVGANNQADGYRPADFPYNQGLDIELIWPEEVIDTTFTISRRLMSSPRKFLKTITAVQLKGREHLGDKKPNYYLKLESPLDSALMAALIPYLRAGESVRFSEKISSNGYVINIYTQAGGIYGLFSHGMLNNPPMYYKRLSETPISETSSLRRLLALWEKDSILQMNAEWIEKYKKGDRLIREIVKPFSCKCETRLEPIGNAIRVSMIKHYPDVEFLIKGDVIEIIHD